MLQHGAGFLKPRLAAAAVLRTSPRVAPVLLAAHQVAAQRARGGKVPVAREACPGAVMRVVVAVGEQPFGVRADERALGVGAPEAARAPALLEVQDDVHARDELFRAGVCGAGEAPGLVPARLAVLVEVAARGEERVAGSAVEVLRAPVRVALGGGREELGRPTSGVRAFVSRPAGVCAHAFAGPAVEVLVVVVHFQVVRVVEELLVIAAVVVLPALRVVLMASGPGREVPVALVAGPVLVGVAAVLLKCALVDEVSVATVAVCHISDNVL